MAWYRAGTVAVTNGSAVVTGTNTAFVANVQIGHAINLPDGRAYEVASVQSDTQLTLGSIYLGPTAGGQPYSIQPNQGFAQDAANKLTGFLSQIQAFFTTALAGRFGSGSAAAPGITFTDDQDTGLRRVGENSLSLVTGGVDRLTVDASGNVSVGISYGSPFDVTRSQNAVTVARITNQDPGANASSGLLLSAYGNSWGWRVGSQAANGNRLDLLVDAASGGSPVLSMTTGGNVGIGTTSPSSAFDVNGAVISVGPKTSSVGSGGNVRFRDDTGVTRWLVGILGTAGNKAFSLYDIVAGSEVVRVDTAGNLLVNSPSANNHSIRRAVSAGGQIIGFGPTAGESHRFYSTDSGGANGAATGYSVDKMGSTGRSITSAGTINASGGDACECFHKSLGCGTILKGDICGIDADGKLTRTWAAAKLFGFKTTNPHLVGRDNWHLKAGPEPEAPLYEVAQYHGPAQPEPVAPRELEMPAEIGAEPTAPTRAVDESDDAYLDRMVAHTIARMAWVQALTERPLVIQQIEASRREQDAAFAAFETAQAAFEAAWSAHEAVVADAEAAHAAAMAAFETEHAAWQDRLTAAAKEIDRIATNGQVPVEFDGPFEVGQILVPIAAGAGIGMKAIDVDAATASEWRRRVGQIIKRLEPDDPDTIETEAIWGRPAAGKPWVFVHRVG